MVTSHAAIAKSRPIRVILGVWCHYHDPSPNVSSTNKWSKNDFLHGKSNPLKKAEEEFNLYLQYMYPSYPPKEMQSFLVLGAVDNKGDPQDRVIYTVGPVVKKEQIYRSAKTMPNTSINQGITILKSI